ncbi:protein-methionine-sulfoxide reductase catalytic subunit MsrP [Pseudobacteriovorax antillogorgiicola]|uniref:Protein-methionine-sulfoxide reductase catalytic subunit MsrP n=1 Tax=Pseudobacteriovorax antillogorgiicola TaxID=1513793 RepID=A0A1Y6BHJ9_9BACT|nr:protein-methionine-sulfoxide reductase catalytic subunit MsrP [Pseudobacteriovorax antillogorgiicola]TCS55490.1 sulfoxide reductase catalytic subunit YedY [Pseudobacteriovorax antillogorgiicola]SMF11803.1 sulfoxide reductase catalytic subunit YedY [Pseudobacteriovorax antillogorgiicola]
MLIKVRDSLEVPSSAITPEDVYASRRTILKAARDSLILSAVGPLAFQTLWEDQAFGLAAKANPKYQEPALKKSITPFKYASSYNNFYEFGTDKSDPKKYAQKLKIKPWTLRVSGHVEKPADYLLEDFLKPLSLEDRVYRFRCVEAWSMVVPWLGFPLRALIAKAKPTSKAKYIRFKTLFDPKQMPGQKSRVLQWPYQEGLRLDEAMNDLSFLAVGMYGKVMPNQNGAPIRLVVPWKYGFKSIKSIVSIEFLEKQPKTSWEISAPQEYPFYSNVNPRVAHPRWSQKTERVLGSGLFAKRQKTLPFNGYADQVDHLYKAFDNTKLY